MSIHIGEQAHDILSGQSGTVVRTTIDWDGHVGKYLVELEDGSRSWWPAWQTETSEQAQKRMVAQATDAMIVERLLNEPIGRVAIPGLKGVTVPVYR